MTNTLVNSLPTVAAVVAFQKKLAEAKKLTFRINFDPEDVQESVFTLAERTALAAHCSAEKLSLEQLQLGETIDSILRYLSEIPVITVTLATKASEDTVQTINTVLHTQLKQKVFLNLTIDPSIVAGATFEFKGKRMSFTLASCIEKVFL